MTPNERIKQVMEDRVIKSVAKKMSIAPGYLSDIMEGRANVTDKTAKLFEFATGYNHQWILTGEGKEIS
jgi:plasmid maintenance system antidote protein VapI